MRSNKWLTVLLVASLALNLALLGAAAWRKWHGQHRPHYPPADFRLDNIHLANAPRQQVQGLLRQFKLRSINAREDILSKRTEILEELGNPAADETKLKPLIDELNRMEAELNRDFIGTLLQISEHLDPPQRLHLLYRLSRPWFFISAEPPPAARNKHP